VGVREREAEEMKGKETKINSILYDEEGRSDVRPHCVDSCRSGVARAVPTSEKPSGGEPIAV